VGFEVLAAVVIKSSVFWDTTPCSALKLNRRFKGTCLQLQGWWMSQAKKKKNSLNQIASRAGFLLGLFFDPEDGGDMYHPNIGRLSTDYMALCPRRYNSPFRCCISCFFRTPLIYTTFRSEIWKSNHGFVFSCMLCHPLEASNETLWAWQYQESHLVQFRQKV
jgi:hypothetical protein